MESGNHTFVKRKYNPSVRDFLIYISENPHKNFPTIVEVCDDFYVIEYIEGTVLSDLLSDTPLSCAVAKEYMLQLSDAVEIMHKFKIVHRDIKPENIIITKDGVVKLIDFDISRKIISSKECDTELLGTAGYAPPEQFGFTQTDERSDIYSLGIVYNCMLTGKYPIEQLADGQAGKIISKCIKVDKKDRYKNIRFLRRDIKNGRFTSYKLLDTIPGFRTGKLYKMIIAMLFYFSFCIGFLGVSYYAVEESDISTSLITFPILALILCYNFFFFAVATNLSGITDKIKFPIKSKKLKTILILLILYLVGSVICFFISGSFRNAIAWNPISMGISWTGYLFYSIIELFLIGML